MNGAVGLGHRINAVDDEGSACSAEPSGEGQQQGGLSGAGGAMDDG